jgi:hypothetical protein
MTVEYETHDGQHQGCAECFRVKLRSLQFQGIGASDRRQSDAERSKDMDAYKQLRRQGLQPKNVFGSSEIAAKASTTWELEHSVVMAPSIRKEMESRMDDAKGVLAQ